MDMFTKVFFGCLILLVITQSFDFGVVIGWLKFYVLVLFLAIVCFFVLVGFSKMLHRLADEKVFMQKSKIVRRAVPKEDIVQKCEYCDSEKDTSNKRDNLIPNTQAEQQSEAVKPVVQIKVDEFKGCYKHKNLSIHDIKYLMNKGYQQIKLKGISDKKPQIYFIKPRLKEGINHIFMISSIAEFLNKKGIIAEKFATRKPDLVFEINNKKFAIEVETGTTYDKSRKQLFEKVKSLNNDYDYWFFVVSDNNYLKKYRKLGKTIDKRYISNQLTRLIKNAKISTCKKESKKEVSRQKKGGKKQK